MTVLLGMPEALVPVQLLWVNLVTDGLPATALGFNPPDHEIMNEPPRDSTEPIVGKWLFFRYCVIGCNVKNYSIFLVYVGAATIGGYAWFYMYASEGPMITWYELTHFHQCDTNCSVFQGLFPMKGATMSLSILVVIEMFNAMNSLSENESLITLPLWTNIYLILAISLSMALHLMILYVPFFNNVFNIVPLTHEEWVAVIAISFPVIILDEILKLVSRLIVVPTRNRMRAEMKNRKNVERIHRKPEIMQVIQAEKAANRSFESKKKK